MTKDMATSDVVEILGEHAEHLLECRARYINRTDDQAQAMSVTQKDSDVAEAIGAAITKLVHYSTLVEDMRA